MAGDMEAAPRAVEQRRAEGGSSSARKAIALRRAVAGAIAEDAAQMPAADRLDMHDARRGKGEARLGVGGAERRQRVEMVDQLRRRRRAGESAPSIASSGTSALAAEPVAEPLGEELAQRVEPCRRRR